MAQITVNELAEQLETTPSQTRKFLRSVTEVENQPGKGGRWSIEKRDIRSLKKKFENFLEEHTQPAKAEEEVTTDEEVGRGTEHFDVKAFGAAYAYTLDGSDLAEIEDETFCADSALVTIQGHDVHPGYAKGKMINAARLAAEFNALIPTTDIPETTEGYEGFYHLLSIEGHCEEGKLSYIIRDHDRQKFEQRKKFLGIF